MSCTHASTTTLLWLYENEPATHDAHIATCEECQAVIAEHGDLMATLGPVLPALASPVPDTSRRVRYAAWGSATLAFVALAASWLLAVPPQLEVRDTGLTPDVASQTAFVVELWPDDAFEADLDALDQELRDLSMDLLTL
jgi:hypothetical protein